MIAHEGREEASSCSKIQCWNYVIPRLPIMSAPWKSCFINPLRQSTLPVSRSFLQSGADRSLTTIMSTLMVTLSFFLLLKCALKNFWTKVVTTLVWWTLEQAGVYNPLSGDTNNQSKGFNCVLKHLQSWSEIHVDAPVMALYHLQAFYFNEGQHGLSG